jgi:hypothetical protein
MATVYELSLQPADQIFFLSLGDFRYRCQLVWCDAVEGGWILDFFNEEGAELVCGIPLVTGADLLEQYRYLNIGGGGHLYCTTYGDPDAPPTRDNLNSASRLLWQPFA